MNTPTKVTEYRDRLVDARKMALVDAILTATANGDQWPSEWPNLRPELFTDVLTKLRRYGLLKTFERPEAASYQPTKAKRLAVTVTDKPALTTAITRARTDQQDYNRTTPVAPPTPIVNTVKECAECGRKDGSTMHYTGPNSYRCGPCDVARRETERVNAERKAAEKQANIDANMIHGTYQHGKNVGSYRLFPSAKALGIQADVAKACTAKLDRERSCLRGKAYLGTMLTDPNDKARPVAVFAPVFTETMGGEPWGVALGRMLEVANTLSWGTRDGAKPGDYIPRTVEEAHQLTTTSIAS